MTDAAPALPRLGFAPGAGDLVLDVDTLLDYGLLVTAASTFGKTTLMRLAAEQTFGHVPHLVLDSDGELLNLRSAARPYLILGKGRDVELPPNAAAVRAVVLRLVELGQSAIVDLTEYDDEEQQLLVAAACDALAARPFDAPGEVLVILAELQDFAPQQGGKGTALAALRRLAKRGAKRGARLLADTQRVADVSKAVVTQLKCKAVGAQDRADMRRAGEELGLPPDEHDRLLQLERGEFYVKAPGVARHATLVRVPPPETMRAKRRRGERPAPPAEAPAEIAALAAALREETAAATEAPADVEQLRAQVRALQAELAAAPAVDTAAVSRAAAAAAAEIANALHPAFRAVQAAAEEARRALDAAWARHVTPAAALGGSFEAPVGASLGAPRPDPDAAGEGRPARAAPPAAPSVRATPRPRVGTQRPGAAPPAPADASAGDGAAAPGGGLPQRVLDGLAAFEAVGLASVARSNAAFFAGASAEGGYFTRTLGALRAQGLVAYPTPGDVALTAAGRARAAQPRRPATRAALLDAWASKLGGLAERVLRALAAAHPRALTREQLAAETGTDAGGGYFTRTLGRLRSLGVIEYPAAGQVAATALLFPKGLR